MLFCYVITYIVVVVIFNLLFLNGKSITFSSGNPIDDFAFLSTITAPGFLPDKIVAPAERTYKSYSLLSMALGLLLIWIAPIEWLIIPGCLFVGLGYGIIQPMLYDKTAIPHCRKKTTLALAFVMMMNYLAILLYPFIVDFFQWIFHTQSQEFPFIFNLLDYCCHSFLGIPAPSYLLFNDQLQ